MQWMRWMRSSRACASASRCVTACAAERAAAQRQRRHLPHPFRCLPWQANPDEVFWYDLEQPEPGGKLPWASWTGGQAETPSAQESALVVNIGSGVSVLKVQAPGAASSPTPVQRISGCSVGGATFWGLARLLTRVRSFDEAVELAGAGDNTRVAMLVKDIYGGEYGKLGLPDGLVAADFGKMCACSTHLCAPRCSAELHLPRSLPSQRRWTKSSSLSRGARLLDTSRLLPASWRAPSASRHPSTFTAPSLPCPTQAPLHPQPSPGRTLRAKQT